ncbi:urea ABC transporter permease subunit UrtB [Alphaproteobacteria bacterium 46_93_T64]|nr:urea ABC transporter permease subunit UrtB [Alphaproteobacteria bacterium 46_93_T64]
MRILKTALLLGLLFVFAEAEQPVHAETLQELTSALSVKSYSKKAVAVKKLAASGAEEAGVILHALMDGALFTRKTDGKIVLGLKNESIYSLSDPINGSALGQAKKSELKKVKINNKVRIAIRAGLGRLDLSHPDSEKRISAAAAIFKSGDPSMLGVLLELVKSETDEDVLPAIVRAAAALELTHSLDIDARINAVAQLKSTGGPEVKALLIKTLSNIQGPATPENLQLESALKGALADVERQLETYGLIENLFQGVSLASVLLLAAIGLAVTFGVMGVINMAHGEMVMIGAYTTYVIQETCRLYFPGFLDFSLIVAIPLAFAVAGTFGILLERSVIRFLYGRPLETLLATWGISLILQQLVRTIFGPTNKEVSTPGWLSGAWEVTSGLSFTYNRIAIIFFALVVLFFLMMVLKRTLFGLQMRAVTQNRMMARSMGIKSARIDAMTFGLGSGVAGMAGVALSQIDNVSPNLGQAYIIDSFMVVVFGGVGNLWGTLVGAGSLGIANKFLEPYSGAVLAKIFVLVAIILFIQKRPRGLFALKGRSVEG